MKVYTKGNYLYSIETIQASFNTRLTRKVCCSANNIYIYARSSSRYLCELAPERTNQILLVTLASTPN